jgi:predicted transcriptional regulator
VSFRRRKPADITYKLLRCIDEQGEATRWDLTKIVGTTSQFDGYVTNFLMKNGFVSERQEGRHYFYSLSERGKELHSLLKKDYLMKAVSRISGKRLSHR